MEACLNFQKMSPKIGKNLICNKAAFISKTMEVPGDKLPCQEVWIFDFAETMVNLKGCKIVIFVLNLHIKFAVELYKTWKKEKT